jgi:hypothetical protein
MTHNQFHSVHRMRAGETYDTALPSENSRVTIEADANSSGRIAKLHAMCGACVPDLPVEDWQPIVPNSTGTFTQSPAPSRWRVICDLGQLVIRSEP